MVLIANLLQGLMMMMMIWNILLVPRSILLNFTGLLISFNNVILAQGLSVENCEEFVILPYKLVSHSSWTVAENIRALGERIILFHYSQQK